MSNMAKEFFLKHWFQLGILAVGLFIAWIAYSAFVLQPAADRQAEERAIVAAQTKEEERQTKLDTCLQESEYQRSSAHLALCGDPNVGRVPSSCQTIYGGATSVFEVLGNYAEYFDTNVTKDPDFFDKYEKYSKSCNCGLEKYRRDEMDQAKSERDKLCLAKYGK